MEGNAMSRVDMDPLEVAKHHIWNRCALGVTLFGVDSNGVDRSYRRKWFVDRLKLQVSLFAIEVNFHAQLINHFHIEETNRPDVVATWSDEEVVRRNLKINKLPRCFDGNIPEPSQAEINIALNDKAKVAEYRIRLSDPSWFMKQLCEYMSRRINKEMDTKGTIWQGPFQSRRLEDDGAALVAGVYIDLNQVRALEAMTPEESVYTSAGVRISGAAFVTKLLENEDSETVRTLIKNRPDGWLAELTLDCGLQADVRKGLLPSEYPRLTDKGTIPIELDEYLELLDWTGRAQVSGKRGAIPAHLAPILERLHINPDQWLDTVTNYNTLFGRSIGRVESLVKRAQSSNRSWIRGVRNCAVAFN